MLRLPSDTVANRQRNTVERLRARLKDDRQVATRYDKLAVKWARMSGSDQLRVDSAGVAAARWDSNSSSEMTSRATSTLQGTLSTR